MIILVLEIGNTAVSCALFARPADDAPPRGDIPHDSARIGDDARLVARFRMPSEARSDSAHYAERLRESARAAGIDAQAIEKVFVSSVVEPLTAVITEAAMAATARRARIIDPHCRLNVTVRPQNRDEIGADIVLNLAEARWRHPRRAVIVVDFGTAVTVSAVDSAGTVCGVAIAPGIAVAIRALTASTQLPEVPLRFPARAMGTDTASAMQSGIMNGYCGLVAALVRDFRRELQERGESQERGEVPVIATGGYGENIHRRISEIDTYEEELTIWGLLRAGILNDEG